MVRKYYRPATLEEALRLLAEEPEARPLAGGLFVLARPKPGTLVDLQGLPLKAIEKAGNAWELGAMATLQDVVENPVVPGFLRELARQSLPHPQRSQATVAGMLVAADGASLWAAGLMALDARLLLQRWQEEPVEVPVGDWLPLRHEWHPGWLITHIRIPLAPKLTWETVRRTPADKPLLLAAVARWPRGRTRVVLGGWGEAPHLALDGPTADGAEVAARNAAYDAEDHRAGKEYRRSVAPILVRRCLERLQAPSMLVN